ncbi:MAG: FAD-dependent oxidoreductase [Lachnospiraceae bacterium]|nr:FAD-dependent oxidoreductase [Lachnospiraceae bacterium]
MILVESVSVPAGSGPEKLKKKTASVLGVRPEQIRGLEIRRKSLDARKKPEILDVYQVAVEVDSQEKILARGRRGVRRDEPAPYIFPESGTARLEHRPVIIGTGPAGLMCGLMLARAGYRPLLLERGRRVEERAASVDAFWNGGELDPDCNVQFGEGGAGTFSDGKLQTSVKDPGGRGALMRRCFADAGAPEDILWEAKPHLGTDVLRTVVRNLREEIIARGGEVRFSSKVTDLVFDSHAGERRLRSLRLADGEEIPAQVCVLAIGHSARDTFRRLSEIGVPMEKKSFAVGLRIQHPQRMIDALQYGWETRGALPAASYKLTASTSGERGVFSFCTCPGGYVVAAASGPEQAVVNGMSYSGRAGENCNSALIVQVRPDDLPEGTLGGVRFQEDLEKRAFILGGGAVPVSTLGAYLERKEMASFGEIAPQIMGRFAPARLDLLLPETLDTSFREAIPVFGHTLPGYDRPDAVLAGIESRTSSPVRILRGPDGQSAFAGLYPCGEGAGYAGGITSAAIDGIRVAEYIAARWARPAEGA